MKTPSFYDLYELRKKQAEAEEEEWEKGAEDYVCYFQDGDEDEEEDSSEDMIAKEESEEEAQVKRMRALEITKETAKKMEDVDDNYCQESNMQEMVLEKAFPGKKWIHNKTIPGAPRRTRPDFRCEELKLIVEYNGHRHYTQARTILADIEKKKMYEDMGYSVVEWPYWLQPDRETMQTMFGCILRGRYCQHFCNYHQGFVSKSCVLPADFCELGVERYNYELSRQDPHTILRVDWSLRNKEKLYGSEAVWCGSGRPEDEFEVYIDGTRSWWRKVHSYGMEESLEIGQAIV